MSAFCDWAVLARATKAADIKKTDGDNAPKLLGRSIDKCEAIVWQPNDPFRYEFVTPKNMRGLIVRVLETFAEQRGWAGRLPRYLKPIPNGFKRLRSLCFDIRTGRVPHTIGTEFALVECLELSFGEQLFVEADPKQNSTNIPKMSFLNQARANWLRLDVQEEGGMDEMARSMGVSRRTLFRTFRQWPGVSPARYSRMLRLAEARRKLIELGPKDASVTSLAQDHGFAHAGRFASDYRAAFGETPSETLRSYI